MPGGPGGELTLHEEEKQRAGGSGLLFPLFSWLFKEVFMLQDGIYALEYRGLRGRHGNSDGALAVLRDGRILGSDYFGGVFAGHYLRDERACRETILLRMRVPPDGELVNGFSAGPEGALIEIVASFECGSGDRGARIDVAGRPIEIKLTYLSPPAN